MQFPMPRQATCFHSQNHPEPPIKCKTTMLKGKWENSLHISQNVKYKKYSQNCIIQRSSVELRNQITGAVKITIFLASRSITFSCGGCVWRGRVSLNISNLIWCEYEIKWDNLFFFVHFRNNKAHLTSIMKIKFSLWKLLERVLKSHENFTKLVQKKEVNLIFFNAQRSFMTIFYHLDDFAFRFSYLYGHVREQGGRKNFHEWHSFGNLTDEW